MGRLHCSGNFVTGGAQKAIRAIHVLVRLVPPQFRWSDACGVDAQEIVAGDELRDGCILIFQEFRPTSAINSDGVLWLKS